MTVLLSDEVLKTDDGPDKGVCSISLTASDYRSGVHLRPAIPVSVSRSESSHTSHRAPAKFWSTLMEDVSEPPGLTEMHTAESYASAAENLRRRMNKKNTFHGFSDARCTPSPIAASKVGADHTQDETKPPRESESKPNSETMLLHARRQAHSDSMLCEPQDAHDVQWHPARKMAAHLLAGPAAYFIAFIIVLNVAFIIYETDLFAKCYPDYKNNLQDCPNSLGKHTWMVVANYIFLAFYTLEAILCFYTFRLRYFRVYWFDFLICLGSWVSVFVGDGSGVNLSWVRVLRVGKLLGRTSLVTMVPELHMLLAGFVGSMRAMLSGGMILVALLCFFSILMVQIIHPINADIAYEGCPRCAKGFRTVAESMLTLWQQIVAGDSWGMISVPVVESNWYGMLLPFTQLVIGIGAMNLILAVIVDSAAAAREADRTRVIEQEKYEQLVRRFELLQVIAGLDADNSGTIDREEIMEAARNSAKFNSQLSLMHISPQELDEIIEATQDRSTGEISYLPLCTTLDELAFADTRKTVVMSKLSLSCLRRDLMEKFDKQERTIEQHTVLLQRINDHLHMAEHSQEKPSTDHYAQQTQKLPTVTAADDRNINERADLMPRILLTPPDSTRLDSLDSKTGIPCLESILSHQTSELRRVFEHNGSSWSNALHEVIPMASLITDKIDVNHATCLSFDTEDSPRKPFQSGTVPAQAEADIPARMQKPLDLFLKQVANHRKNIHQGSELRRAHLFEGFVRDLEGDAASLKEQCKLLLSCESFVAEVMMDDTASSSHFQSPFPTLIPRAMPWLDVKGTQVYTPSEAYELQSQTPRTDSSRDIGLRVPDVSLTPRT